MFPLRFATGDHQTLVGPRMSFEIGEQTDGDDPAIYISITF